MCRPFAVVGHTRSTMSNAPHIIVLACLCLTWCSHSIAQTASPQQIASSLVSPENASMELLEEQTTARDRLQATQIDINSQGVDGLIETGLLTPVHVAALQHYRATCGDLISVYELQAVPHFDVELIRSILPFITIDGQSTSRFISRITSGTHHVAFRWRTTFQSSRAYHSPDSTKPYAGDRSGVFFRYRYSSRSLDAAFVVEKDPGERLLSSAYGPDYTGVSFTLHNVSEENQAIGFR